MDRRRARRSAGSEKAAALLAAFSVIIVLLRLLAIGVVVALPTLKMDPVTDFATRGDGPVFAGTLFPFVFITIACGALCGFHSLIASGTTPKMIQKETQVRMIGYGSMYASGMYAAPRSPRSARRRTSNRRSSPRPG